MSIYSNCKAHSKEVYAKNTFQKKIVFKITPSFPTRNNAPEKKHLYWNYLKKEIQMNIGCFK